MILLKQLRPKFVYITDFCRVTLSHNVGLEETHVITPELFGNLVKKDRIHCRIIEAVWEQHLGGINETNDH